MFGALLFTIDMLLHSTKLDGISMKLHLLSAPLVEDWRSVNSLAPSRATFRKSVSMQGNGFVRMRGSLLINQADVAL